MTDVLNEVRAQTEPYADEHRPLAGYAVLSSGFGVAFSLALAAAASRRGELPERIRIGDIAMAGIATHKLTRLIAKDRVTSFLRAPFVTYQEPSGHGEIEEAPRGQGLRLAVGELLVCPYCLAQWVVAALTVGYVSAPRFTRLIAAMYTAEAASDFLQLAYLAAEKRS